MCLSFPRKKSKLFTNIRLMATVCFRNLVMSSEPTTANVVTSALSVADEDEEALSESVNRTRRSVLYQTEIVLNDTANFIDFNGQLVSSEIVPKSTSEHLNPTESICGLNCDPIFSPNFGVDSSLPSTDRITSSQSESLRTLVYSCDQSQNEPAVRDKRTCNTIATLTSHSEPPDKEIHCLDKRTQSMCLSDNRSPETASPTSVHSQHNTRQASELCDMAVTYYELSSATSYSRESCSVDIVHNSCQISNVSQPHNPLETSPPNLEETDSEQHQCPYACTAQQSENRSSTNPTPPSVVITDHSYDDEVIYTIFDCNVSLVMIPIIYCPYCLNTFYMTHQSIQFVFIQLNISSDT